jgi:hypothetical protein
MDHAVVSEAIVTVVIVVEKSRKTGVYDNDHDNDKDKAELSSLPAQTKLMPLGEKLS